MSSAKNNDHVQKEPEFEGDMDTSLFDSDKMLSENKSITPGKSPNHEQLPLPSIEIELQQVSEVRENPSGSHERASVVIFPGRITQKKQFFYHFNKNRFKKTRS